jgi:hypothetical protein
MSNSKLCGECRELISAYIDGELNQDERARLMSHVAVCDDCRATLETYRSIGNQIRALPPLAPPARLADGIYANTIDVEPRRLLFLTSRVGYSVAAVAAVVCVFIVAAYLLIGGYQRGIRPAVASYVPGQDEIWPLQKPVEITFNKAMDHESVQESLVVSPEDPDNPPRLEWDGNTLIIGEGQSFLPGTVYRIHITAGAKDTFGNHMETDFALKFTTSTTVEAFQSPTPQPTAEPTEPANSTPVSTPQPGQPTPTVDRSVVIVTPTQEVVIGPPASTPSSPVPGETPDTVEPFPTLPTDLPEPTPTPTPDDDDPPAAPTATPTPSPTPTATATIPAVPPTPTPTPPAPTPTNTPSVPTATPTPDIIPVTGAFGNIYWGDEAEYYRQRLGEPIEQAWVIDALSLQFQNGEMYRRGDAGLIYVFDRSNLTWESRPDVASTLPDSGAGTEDGLWIPGGAFGYLWLEDEYVQQLLGYALDSEATSFQGQVQAFEHGLMLLGPTDVYVLFDDFTMDLRPAVFSSNPPEDDSGEP